MTLERIEVIGEVQPGQPIQFKAVPDVAKYEALVFGSPVQAFSLCQAMADYLKQVAPLQGKQVAWLGGNRAIRQMKRLCAGKGTTVCGSGIVNWMRKSRGQQIVEVVDKLSCLF